LLNTRNTIAECCARVPASNHARRCGAEQRDEKTLDRRSSRGFQN
jgi:hypothetical protein